MALAKSIIREAIIEEFTIPRIEQKRYAWIQFLTARSGRVMGIEDNAADFWEIVRPELLVKVGDLVKCPVQDSSHRSGYLIHLGDEPTSLNTRDIIRIITEKLPGIPATLEGLMHVLP